VLFALLGASTAFCWWQIRLLGDLREHVPGLIGWCAAAFAIYLAGLGLVRRLASNGEGSASRTRGLLGLVVFWGVVARLLLLDTQPTLSPDVYRYLWDGRVQLAGFNPYAHAPDHPVLRPLRDASFDRVLFPHLRTVYPPMAQAAFQLGARIDPSVLGQKLLLLLAELALLVSLLGILRARGLSPLWVLAYAWHPLVILELVGSGHSDVVGMAWLWAGVAAWHLPARQAGTRRWMPTALCWAAAFLSKFMSVVLAIWWVFRRAAWRWLAGFLVLAVAPLLLWPSALSALIESLTAVTGRVESNASLYLIVLHVVGNPGVARGIVGGAWVGFLLWWGHRQSDPLRFLLGAFGTMALLTPVLHPWYVLWLVPFLCFWRIPAMVALTGTVLLAYTVWPQYATDGIWRVPMWARSLEYAPVVILGLWELKRCKWASLFRLGTKPQVCLKS